MIGDNCVYLFRGLPGSGIELVPDYFFATSYISVGMDRGVDFLSSLPKALNDLERSLKNKDNSVAVYGYLAIFPDIRKFENISKKYDYDFFVCETQNSFKILDNDENFILFLQKKWNRWLRIKPRPSLRRGTSRAKFGNIITQFGNYYSIVEKSVKLLKGIEVKSMSFESRILYLEKRLGLSSEGVLEIIKNNKLLPFIEKDINEKP